MKRVGKRLETVQIRTCVSSKLKISSTIPAIVSGDQS